jgi:hypothetical protein
MFYYRAYQLNVQSDIPLGNISQIPPCTPDVIIHQATDFPMIPSNASRMGNYATLENQFWITEKVGSFHIEDGNKITYSINTRDLAPTVCLSLFLCGSCFAGLLLQRGMVVLHANTLSWNRNTGIAFSGDSGAGKSTATAWHIKQGALLVADDISAIEFKEGSPYVLSGFSRLKLWNDSKDMLNLTSLESLYTYDGRSKHHIDLKPEQFLNDSVKLEKLIIIHPDINEEEEITGQNKITSLIENNYTAPIFKLFNTWMDQLKGNLNLASKLSIVHAPRPCIF